MQDSARKFDPARLRILVVDDNAQMRGILQSLLRGFGVRAVSLAVDGSDALDQLERRQFDIAICDWLMEPMDGYEFVRAVRASDDPAIRELPVVMLTGQSEKRQVLAAREAGVTEYLLKPIAAGLLWSRLAAAYARGAHVPADPRAAPAIAAADRGMQALSDLYEATLVADCGYLDLCLTDLFERDWDRIETWRLLRKKAHDVKGQAGSFGYRLATDIAHSLVRSLTPVLEEFGRRNDRQLALRHLLSAHVDALKLIANQRIKGDGGAEGRDLLDELEAKRFKLDPGAARRALVA
ncbi:MAG: response regulator [Tagaea sp.]|nr:response regulator [Tagaea sp.]